MTATIIAKPVLVPFPKKNGHKYYLTFLGVTFSFGFKKSMAFFLTYSLAELRGLSAGISKAGEADACNGPTVEFIGRAALRENGIRTKERRPPSPKILFCIGM
jgi:hypothetical protein